MSCFICDNIQSRGIVMLSVLSVELCGKHDLDFQRDPVSRELCSRRADLQCAYDFRLAAWQGAFGMCGSNNVDKAIVKISYGVEFFNAERRKLTTECETHVLAWIDKAREKHVAGREADKGESR